MRVIGLGFGDEGKGTTVSNLIRMNPGSISEVVRFNGGHQAGHTVVHDGVSHVFSGFGSGTLQGVPTYWGPDCTFYPPSFNREWDTLVKKGVSPIIYIHPDCPVTTYWDIEANRTKEDWQQRHGSVGMGFGATLQRESEHYHLTLKDLYYPTVAQIKLEALVRHYRKADPTIHDVKEMGAFLEQVSIAIQRVTPRYFVPSARPGGDHLIFEGAQGILLDQKDGFFPNVTRSFTTSRNLHTLCPSEIPNPTYYVTRTYLTRHGAGPLPGEDPEFKSRLNNLGTETNKSHAYQGEFRYAPLNVELLNYAMRCDAANGYGATCLVITCMDQLEIDVYALIRKLHRTIDKIYVTHGPTSSDMEEIPRSALKVLK